MNIKHTELVDALVLTTSDSKIISCAGCCVRDKMLRNEKNKGSNSLNKLACIRLRNWSRKR